MVQWRGVLATAMNTMVKAMQRLLLPEDNKHEKVHTNEKEHVIGTRKHGVKWEDNVRMDRTRAIRGDIFTWWLPSTMMGEGGEREK
ncbi:hypothetical protein NPIL_586281 [Nephila pilipes]|uniref:Uncharacterized protein n=1 Tax=Nephila pilipes TaxID=299642 RepID=A0A8X6I3U1_NEPPI|nr:hypothetical protein NPIL_586281 [Nephila pilipes]